MNDRLLKKQTYLFIMISFLIILLVIGITYAYFSAGVSNTNNEKINAHAATLSLVFEDNDNGISGNLSLGESVTKKFTLENTGTKDAYAKINWYNLVNTYTADSLTYTLEQSTSENGSYSRIDSGKVPISNVAITQILKNKIIVPVSTKYYYKLTITLNNLDNNQNNDINAKFSSYFNLEEDYLSGTERIIQLTRNASTNSTNVITSEAPEGENCTNTLAYDGTNDNNLRYVGKNPCNYVTFNEETAGWRIIGIMNNVDNGTGKKETRIKLIRKFSLDSYSWDTSNNGAGVNDWSKADLKNELNGDYLDTTLTENTMWYNGYNNQKEFNYTKRLRLSSQKLIENAKWYLGGRDSGGVAASWYISERGTRVWGSASGQTCNDGACPRATSWVGKVALMYPSDFGFAVGGGMRNTCLTYTTYSSSNECFNNDWLSLNSYHKWLLSPRSNVASGGYRITLSGMIDHGYFNNTASFEVNPVIYLKSKVTISSGNGSVSNPYTLS